jgi:hypothetical protein
MKITVLEINHHEKEARKYLQLSTDNLAVAMSEDCGTVASQNRKQEYLGYAEDYARLAYKEMTKGYQLFFPRN